MTTTGAPPPATDSLVDPLIIFTSVPDPLLGTYALHLANWIPQVPIFRRAGNSMIARTVSAQRMVVTSQPDPGRYTYIQELYDRIDEEKLRKFGSIKWKVRVVLKNPSVFGPAGDGSETALEITLAEYTLRNGVLVGAPQLALLRHLWWTTIHRLEPTAQAYGGQHDWDPTWWPNTAAAAGS